MKFLDNEIKLVIFDLDGTLIDSTSLWSNIDYKFFSRRNMDIPPTYNLEIAHLGLNKAAEWTSSKYLNGEDVEKIKKEWMELALEEYENAIPLKKYAKEILDLFKNKDVRIALATANSEQLYLPCLKRLGIDSYFDYIIDVNSCKNGKNSPEIYDRVSDRFNAKNNETLVFEDMLEALKTAYNAGYNVVGINDKHSVSDINHNKKYCHMFIDDFSEILPFIK